MKMKKRVFSLVMLIVLVFTMSMGAFASGDSKTITIENPTLDKTYSAYKIMDAQVDPANPANVTYTIDSNSVWYNSVSTSDVFDLKNIGGTTYQASQKANKETEFKTWMKNLTVPESATAAASKQCTGAGELVLEVADFGYYYVSTGTGSAVTIDTVNKNIVLQDKNDTKPGPQDSKNYKTVSETSVAVGSTANFSVQFKATNFVVADGAATRIEKYVITDTPTNVTIDWSTLNVTIAGVTVVSSGAAVTGYTDVVAIDTTAKTITLTWATASTVEDKQVWSSRYASPSDVVATYTGTVDGVGTTASTNAAKIDYYTVGSTSPTTLGPNSVTLPNYTVEIKKVDGNANPLAGAKFKLYSVSTGGTPISLEKVSDGVYQPKINGTQADELECNSSCILKIQGLAAGTYYLEESTVPSGYVGLSERKVITISSSDLTDTAAISIINTAGTALPTTGGMGTTLFYLIGGILVLGAVVFFITRKRMESGR